MYAFSGIHTFAAPLSHDGGLSREVSHQDFYLQNCGKVPICGFVKDNLLLMDVGKLDTLDDAQAFVNDSMIIYNKQYFQ